MKALLAEQENVHEPAGLMVIARLGNVAVGMATVPVLIHFLGAGGFAAWALLLAMSFAFGGLEIGMPPSFVKHAAPLLRVREWHEAKVVLASALALLALVFSLVALPVALLAQWIAHKLQLPDSAILPAASMVLLVYAAVALRSLLQFGVHTLTAARRFRAVALAMFAQSFAANVASALVAAWTRRLDLSLLAYWGAQLLVVAAVFAFSRRVFEGDAAPAAPSTATMRQLMPHGFKIQLGDWAQTITFQYDKFIIASWLGLVSVASYEVANRSILALRSIPSSGLDSFLPSAAIGHADAEQAWQRYLSVTRLAATAVTIFMLAPLAIAPVFLFAWTGEVGYAARFVFAGLFFGFAANVLALPATAMVQAAGRADLQARAAIVTLLVNVPLSLLLLLRWGMTGAAIGTSLAMITGAWLLLSSMHRAYGRPLRATLAMLASYWPALLACALLALLVHFPFEHWLAGIPEAARNGWRTRLPLAGVAIAAYFASAAVLLALQLRSGLLTRSQLGGAARWLRGQSRPEQSLSPEAELLLACAQIAPPTQEQRQRIASLLADGIDWPQLLELAEAHGLLALLFRALRAEGLPPMPRDVELRLWTYQEQLRRKNRLMSEELLAILALFESEGIAAVPYKGPVLAETIYGDLEHREFGDLDLLLAPGDIVRARNLLATRGYQPLFALTPALERALLDSPDHYHLALKQRIMVELHWRTDAEFPVADLADPAWWSTRPSVRFGNRMVPALEVHELVLALLLHGSKHLWEQLNWVAELAELIRRYPELDWDWILRTAERLRARRRVAVGLLLLARYFDSKTPPQVVEWVAREDRVEPLAGEIGRRWFAAPKERVPGAFGRLSLNYALYDSEAQRIGHALRVVFRPGFADWSVCDLPRPLHVFYVPIRVSRLGWKYLSGGRAAEWGG